MTLSSVPPLFKHPRSDSSSVPPQVSRFRDILQKSRYDLFQGTKYSCGRQVEWEAYKHANFYAEVHKYFEDMGWLGFVATFEKEYSFLLVNEFYAGLLLYANEYLILTRFQDDSLYTFFNREE